MPDTKQIAKLAIAAQASMNKLTISGKTQDDIRWVTLVTPPVVLVLCETARNSKITEGTWPCQVCKHFPLDAGYPLGGCDCQCKAHTYQPASFEEVAADG
jgi:hypothetical protein